MGDLTFVHDASGLLIGPEEPRPDLDFARLASATDGATGADLRDLAAVAGDVEVTGDGPLYVKEKVFRTEPLTLAQALDEMELVGHDFFLYVDAESGRPSAVYRRRKGYNYGVIHLDVDKEK